MSEPRGQSEQERGEAKGDGGFGIAVRGGRTWIRLHRRAVADAIVVLSAEAFVEGERSLSSPAELASTATILSGLALEVDVRAIARKLEAALALSSSVVTRLRLAPSGGGIGVDARLSAHGHSVRTSGSLVVGLSGDRAVRLELIDLYRFGHVDVPADELIRQTAQAAASLLPARVLSETSFGVTMDVLPSLLLELFAGDGLRVPRYAEISLSRAYVSRNGSVVLVFGEVDGLPAEADPSDAERGSARVDAASPSTESRAIGEPLATRFAALMAGLDTSSGPSALAARVLSLGASDASTFADTADLATDLLSTAPEGDSIEAAAHLALAEIADATGRTAEAATHLESAGSALLQSGRRREAALAFLASALTSRAEEAERAVEAAIRAFPSDPDVAAAEVGSLLARGDAIAAVSAAERVVAQSDELDRGPAHVLLGEALLACGEAIRAKRAFEKALFHDPRDADALSGLARALEQRGDRRRAAAVLERLAREAESSKDDRAAAFSEALGDLWLERDPEAATARYRRALSVLPGSVDLLAKLEVAARRARRPELALEALDRAASIAPSSRRAELALEAARLVRDELRRPRQALDRMVEVAKSYPGAAVASIVSLLEEVVIPPDDAARRVIQLAPIVEVLTELDRESAWSLVVALAKLDVREAEARSVLIDQLTRLVRSRGGVGLELALEHAARGTTPEGARILSEVLPALSREHQVRALAASARWLRRAGLDRQEVTAFLDALEAGAEDVTALVGQLVSGLTAPEAPAPEQHEEAAPEEGALEDAGELAILRAQEAEPGLPRARRWLEAAETIAPVARISATEKERLERALYAANEAASSAPGEAEPHRRVAAYARALDQVEAELVALGRLAEITKDRAERVSSQLRRVELLRGPIGELEAAQIELEEAVELMRGLVEDERSRLVDHLRALLGRNRFTGEPLVEALKVGIELAKRTEDHRAHARFLGRLLEVVDDSMERADLHVALGEVLEWKLGEGGLAERQYLAALAAVPSHETATKALTSLYLAADRFGDLAENLGVPALQEIFQQERDAGRDRRTIAAAEALWPLLERESQERAEVLLALSDLYRTVRNEVDATLMLLEEVVSHGPSSMVGEALDRLRVLSLEEGRRDLYVAGLRKNAERVEDDAGHALALAGIGEYFENELEDQAAAEREYRAALAVDANCAPARRRLSALFAGKGRFAELGRDLGAAALKAELERLLRRGDSAAMAAAEALAPMLEESRRGDLWRELSRLLTDAQLARRAAERADQANAPELAEQRFLSVRELRRESIRPTSELNQGTPEVTPVRAAERPRVEPHNRSVIRMSPSASFGEPEVEQTREWARADVAALLAKAQGDATIEAPASDTKSPEAQAVTPVAAEVAPPAAEAVESMSSMDDAPVEAATVEASSLAEVSGAAPIEAPPQAAIEASPLATHDAAPVKAEDPPIEASSGAASVAEKAEAAVLDVVEAAPSLVAEAPASPASEEGAAPIEREALEKTARSPLNRAEEASASPDASAPASPPETPAPSGQPEPAGQPEPSAGTEPMSMHRFDPADSAEPSLRLLSWAESDSTPPPWGVWSEPRALWMEPKLVMRAPKAPIASFGRRALVLAALEVPDARIRAVAAARRLLFKRPDDAALAARLGNALHTLGDDVGALGPTALADFIHGRPSDTGARPVEAPISSALLLDHLLEPGSTKPILAACNQVFASIAGALPHVRPPTTARPRRTLLPDDPLRKAAESVAKVAGVDVTLALLPSAQGAWVEPGSPPTLVIGDDLEVADPVTQRFVLGRAVIRARLGGLVLDYRREDLSAWLEWLSGGAPPLPTLPRLPESGISIDSDLFARTIERTADRFGLLTAGRPARVLELVAEGGDAQEGLKTRGSRLFALASFLVSKDHARLLLGLSGYTSHAS